MIEKMGRDDFVLSCDYCNDICSERFEDFYDAVDWKKDSDNGWRCVKDKDDDFVDLCPACNTPDVIRELKGVEDL